MQDCLHLGLHTKTTVLQWRLVHGTITDCMLSKSQQKFTAQYSVKKKWCSHVSCHDDLLGLKLPNLKPWWKETCVGNTYRRLLLGAEAPTGVRLRQRVRSRCLTRSKRVRQRSHWLCSKECVRRSTQQAFHVWL